MFSDLSDRLQLQFTVGQKHISENWTELFLGCFGVTARVELRVRRCTNCAITLCYSAYDFVVVVVVRVFIYSHSCIRRQNWLEISTPICIFITLS